MSTCETWMIHISHKPIADRVARNLEIISKTFQLSTRHSTIFTGLIMSTMSLRGTNLKSYGQNSGLLTKILCRPIGNRMYHIVIVQNKKFLFGRFFLWKSSAQFWYGESADDYVSADLFCYRGLYIKVHSFTTRDNKTSPNWITVTLNQFQDNGKKKEKRQWKKDKEGTRP